MATLIITRRETEHYNVNRYSVETDVALSDGSMEADFFMCLVGNVLQPIIQIGLIRTGRTLKIQLGPKSLAQITALNVGDAVILHT